MLSSPLNVQAYLKKQQLNLRSQNQYILPPQINAIQDKEKQDENKTMKKHNQNYSVKQLIGMSLRQNLVIGEPEIQKKSKIMVDLPSQLKSLSTIFYKPQQISFIMEGRKYINTSKETKNEEKQDSLNSKWKSQLRYFYNYFCKLGYITGKYSTFQRIKVSTNLMNIGKFINCCRNFQINEKLTDLQNIFKLSTNYKSLMNYEEFLQALFMISNKNIKQNDESQNEFINISSKINQNQQMKNTNSNKKKSISKWSQKQKLQNLIKYLNRQIATEPNIKKQLILLNQRRHGMNAHENLVKVNPTNEYRFKMKFVQGKNAEQMKEQVKMRKEKKQFAKQRARQGKETKRKIERQKFIELNKLSISEKKITKGGYMSPPKLKKETIKTVNFSVNKNQSSNVSKSKFNPSNIELISFQDTKMSRIQKDKGHFHRKNRHRTQVNEDKQIFQMSNEQNIISKQQIRKGEVSDILNVVSQSSSTYLKTYLSKDRRENNKSKLYKDKFQINKIIKQAKYQIKPISGDFQHSLSSMKLNEDKSQVQRGNVNNFGKTPNESDVFDIKLWLEDLNQKDEYLDSIINKKE